MKSLACAAALVFALAFAAQPAWAAFPPRTDVIWARQTTLPIVLDGVLDEPMWAQAESVQVRYRQDNGIPGSGWKDEVGFIASDPTRAWVKFLTKGNQLFLAFIVPDSSIGGTATFNRFDGLLMAVKDHLSAGRPAPPSEYFYSYWYDNVPSAPGTGDKPFFRGRWGNGLTPAAPRTPAQVAAWDAFTRVRGLANSDAQPDTGYVVEMKFDLGVMGYDVTDADGDIVEWNLSIYDIDWLWPLQPFKLSGNRAWIQGPWGNANGYNEMRVYSRPSVTTGSGPVPVVAPEVIVPNGGGYPAPVIDGNLNEAVWANAPSFKLQFGNDALRDAYPGIARWRAGQFQPPVNGGLAFVNDPSEATVKYFFRGDSLYFGFNVVDQVVQYTPTFDRWDGFQVSVTTRNLRESQDHTLDGKRLSFQVGPTGAALPQDYLPTLIDSAGARVALVLKAGTTIDTTGLDIDAGYTAELLVDLTKLSYAPGLGDRLVWFGVNYFDGDSYTPFTDSYGTRTWWFREYENICCAPWGVLDAATFVTGVEPPSGGGEGGYALLGNAPNPFGRSTTLRYALPRASQVRLQVFDLQGRLVASRDYGVQPAGQRTAPFSDPALATGVYLYRLQLTDPESARSRAELSGKMMILD